MADFPSARYHLPVISSQGTESGALGGAAIAAATSVTGASATWPTANLAIYVPFRIWAPYLAKIVWWANGATVTGNVDCGIYTVGGTLLASAGSTAQATINTIQTVTLGTALWLSPGSYFMALNSSSASATFMRSVGTQGLAAYLAGGYQQQAVGSVTLPATATFAAIVNAFSPFFGIASTTVI